MTDVREGIYSARYRWTTIGALSLVFLNAFQTLAVTTIMPLISAELDGRELYALAFAAPLAAGVVGMVIGGNWADRVGPAAPLSVSAVIFTLGLVIAGVAPSMAVLVLGRLVLGFGGGAVTVALYVLIARVFPATLHPKVFAGFSTAWVVPALVGPAVAGFIAEGIGWRWVFLAVVVLVAGSTGLILPSVRALTPAEGDAPPWALRRIAWSVLAAAAVLAVSLSGQAGEESASESAVPIVLAVVAAAVALFAARTLVPRGTLLARRGLPSIILLRGLVSATFFGAEVYIPYLLQAEYGFDAAIAGLALTGGTLTWATAAQLQGSARLSDAACLTGGSLLLLASTSVVIVATVLMLHPAVLMVGWAIGGAGMGLAFPRLNTMTLARSAIREQGFNSAALTIAQSLGAALALAVTGVVVAYFASLGGAVSFVAVFVLAALFALAAVIVSPRVRELR